MCYGAWSVWGFDKGHAIAALYKVKRLAAGIVRIRYAGHLGHVNLEPQEGSVTESQYNGLIILLGDIHYIGVHDLAKS